MRDYAKVEPKAWHGGTFKTLRKMGPEALIVGFYLMTSPSSNMLGLYVQPVLYMAHETGLGAEGAWKGLRACIEGGFCDYDEPSEFVWVYEMARYQIAPSLKSDDKRVIGVRKDYEALADNPFLGPFFDRYADAFHLLVRREVLASPLQAPCKPRTRTGEGTGEGAGAGEQGAIAPSSAAAHPTRPALQLVDGGAGQPAKASKRKASRKAPTADDIPPWMQGILDLYHEVLPDLPGVVVMNAERQQAMRDFRDWVLHSKLDGKPRATNDEEMLAWSRRYFERARLNDWIMGRVPRPAEHKNWKPSIEWLLSAKGMQKVIEQTEAAA